MSQNQEGHGHGHEHGHDKEYTIIVNTREKVVTEKELSFSDIVALAYETPPTGPNIVFTVTYRRGHGNQQGSLVEGQSVKIKDGMVFDVSCTDKS